MLKLGSTGRAVSFLQARIALSPTGTFDAATQAALQSRQAALGLVADGVYGPLTNAAMTNRSANAIANAAQAAGIDARTLQAVANVESSGTGFFADGRPVILLERHYVWARASIAARTTLGASICSPTPGGYVGGVGEWDRFEQVAAVCGDEIAAQSCSWGLGQVMGANYALPGYTSAFSLMAASARDENWQLSIMAAFIGNQPGMRNALTRQDWQAFARLYNGPNYAQNAYDTKLAAAYDALA